MRFAGVTTRLNPGPILLPDLCYHHSALPTAETSLLSVPQTHMRIPTLVSLATPPPDLEHSSHWLFLAIYMSP